MNHQSWACVSRRDCWIPACAGTTTGRSPGVTILDFDFAPDHSRPYDDFHLAYCGRVTDSRRLDRGDGIRWPIMYFLGLLIRPMPGKAVGGNVCWRLAGQLRHEGSVGDTAPSPSSGARGYTCHVRGHGE